MAFDRSWHRSYPHQVPPEIEFESLAVPEFLSRSARRYPDNDAVVFMGKRISYRELDGMVNRFARVLTDLGIRSGDTVAMLLPNIPQMVIASYAAFRIGAVVAMNNPLYTERELAYQLDDSDATLLVTLDLLVPRVLSVRPKTKIDTVIACHINDYLPFPKKQLFPFVKRAMFRKVREPGVLEFADLIRRYPDAAVDNAARWADTAALLYTGGTTGVSKGAMLTHANISKNVQQLATWTYDMIEGGERVLAVFPFFHSAGFTGVQNLAVYKGWTMILVPRPEPDIVCEMIGSYRPSLVPGVPTIFNGLLNNEKFKSMELSFIKGFFAGAAPLPVDTIRQLEELTGGRLSNVYGLTETSPMGTATPWGGVNKPGTVGVPLPGTDLKIVDVETGTREMKTGEPGEILFKGPQVMKGYYKKPEETAVALRDGWLFTGDIGCLDEDGYLTIVDRKKDMIVASGYNIYPQEVDDVLFDHPRILEACTIGVPDAYRGETVKAYVVPKTGQRLETDELIAFCRDRLSPYKVPTIIEFVDELPKSAVGKILRRELKAMDQAKREA